MKPKDLAVLAYKYPQLFDYHINVVVRKIRMHLNEMVTLDRMLDELEEEKSKTPLDPDTVTAYDVLREVAENNLNRFSEELVQRFHEETGIIPEEGLPEYPKPVHPAGSDQNFMR